MRILISDQNFGDDAQLEREAAEAADVEITVDSCQDEDDVAAPIACYRPDALLVQFAPVGRKTLALPAGLRGIVRYDVGVDNVDVAAVEEFGVGVVRILDYCLDEVADHTLGLLLALGRGLLALAGVVEAGGWSVRGAGSLRRIRGRTFGPLGIGTSARRRERPAGLVTT